MFDNVFVDRGKVRKPWTLAVSLVLQCTFVGVLILIPLIYTEALPRMMALTTIGPPPASQPPQPERIQQAVPHTRPVSDFDEGKLVFVHIPKTIAQVVDEPEIATPGQGVLGGVQGGDPTASARNLDIMRFVETRTPEPPPPQPKPAPQTIVRQGGDVQNALAISQPKPEYPPMARMARISGVVRLHAIISETGTIEELKLIDGPALLTKAAMDAVARWRYRPTLLNGVPVKVETEIEVHFTLNQ